MPTKDEIIALFKVFDKDGSGTLTLDEVKGIMCRPTPDGEPLSAEELATTEEMFKKYDKNGDGVLDIEEFTAMYEPAAAAAATTEAPAAATTEAPHRDGRRRGASRLVASKLREETRCQVALST